MRDKYRSLGAPGKTNSRKGIRPAHETVDAHRRFSTFPVGYRFGDEITSKMIYKIISNSIIIKILETGSK